MSLNHEQWWDKWEFRLEWVGDVHRTRDLEERVHRVMDYVGINLALRTLNPTLCVSGAIRVKVPHTKLYELGFEGQFRHWYLTPMMV